MSTEEFDKAAEAVEDEIRDIWPTLRGADILLFQNDLFCKIRQLETKCEGGSARGFLPAAFEELHSVPSWTGGEEYESAWNELIGLCNVSVLEQLDIFEEHVCDWIEDMIPEELNFFSAALEQGILNVDWLLVAAEQLAKSAVISSTSSIIAAGLQIKHEGPSHEPAAVIDARFETEHSSGSNGESPDQRSGRSRDPLSEIKEVDLTRLAYTRRRVSRPYETTAEQRLKSRSKPSLRKTRRKSPI